jgi:hypothetical protein
MNILLFSSATNNIGETYSLSRFAKELIDDGHICQFVAPALGKNYLLSMGFKERGILHLPPIKGKEDKYQNYLTFKTFTQAFKFDFAIVADWYEYGSDGMSADNSYSIYWPEENVKFGTFDHFGYDPSGSIIELFRNGFKIERQIKAIPERFSFIIRPCPHHDNSCIKKDNIYFWALNKTVGNSTSTHPVNLLGQVPIRILFPIGFWQEYAINKACKLHGLNTIYYYDVLIPMLQRILEDLDLPFILYVVSQSVKTSYKVQLNKVETIFLPPQSHKNFTTYLDNCDILFSDNLISSNIGKALDRPIIPIVFQNAYSSHRLLEKINQFSLQIRLPLQMILNQGIIPAFKSFPTGFNDIPEITRPSNKFMSCFVTAELFDIDDLKNVIGCIIKDEAKRREIREAKTKYRNKNRLLLTASQILLRQKINN